MNEDMREMIAEDMGLLYCNIVDSYVVKECAKHCDECKHYIEFCEYFESEQNKLNKGER